MSFQNRVEQKKREFTVEKQRQAAEKAAQERVAQMLRAELAAAELTRRVEIEADPRWKELMSLANSPELDEALRAIWEISRPGKTREIIVQEATFWEKQTTKTVLVETPFNKVVEADYDTSNPNQPVGHIIVRVGYDLKTQSYTEVSGGIRLILTWREEAVVEEQRLLDDVGWHVGARVSKDGYGYPNRGTEITGVNRNAGLAIETNELALADNDKKRKIPDGHTDKYAPGICFYSLDELLNFLAAKIVKEEHFFNDSNPYEPDYSSQTW